LPEGRGQNNSVMSPSGKWSFDPDDALYLMPVIAWLGWLSGVLVGAAIGTTAMMIITLVRLLRAPEVNTAT
jgi:hypothetical protein